MVLEMNGSVSISHIVNVIDTGGSPILMEAVGTTHAPKQLTACSTLRPSVGPSNK